MSATGGHLDWLWNIMGDLVGLILALVLLTLGIAIIAGRVARYRRDSRALREGRATLVGSPLLPPIYPDRGAEYYNKPRRPPGCTCSED